MSISFLNLSFNIPWCWFCDWAAILSLQGGALWFQNLSALPGGSFGPVFPILIAGFHYINIQVFAITWLNKYVSMDQYYAFYSLEFLFCTIVTIEYSNCRLHYYICLLLTLNPFPDFFWFSHNSSNYWLDRVAHESELNKSYLLPWLLTSYTILFCVLGALILVYHEDILVLLVMLLLSMFRFCY